MIMSTLCRKVFQQVSLDENLMNAFWVERRLQVMQINGLVKMIQQSPKNEIEYIDGYLPRYKWAFRPSVLDISKTFDIYCLIQQFDTDFPWGAWEDLSKVTDIITFKECILYASQNFKPLSYAFAMYQSKTDMIEQCRQKVNHAMKPVEQIVVKAPSIEEREKLNTEWENMKKYMKQSSWDAISCN